MTRRDSLIRTKLAPPRLPPNTLARARVDALLRQALDYRLTILQVGAGYGKSTALAQLGNWGVPLFWYSASEGDTDPYQFLLHLIAAFRLGLPELDDTPNVILQDPYAGSAQATVVALINALSDSLHAPAVLVIDDYHLAASDEVNALLDAFLSFVPADLHVIIATRHVPQWEHLITWQAHGQVIEIKRDALAFARDEIEMLFRDKYGIALSPREVALLEEKTEGWPIGLQLVWQELRANPRTSVVKILTRERTEATGSLDALFAYLAHDVLAQQSHAVQEFLAQSAVLRELDAAACGVVTSQGDCHAMLTYLRERDLFLIALDNEHYRYHHLFHDFLREHAAQLDADAVRARHRRAAEFYQRAENWDEAVYHWLQAQAYDHAIALIERIGENVLREGKLETLSHWIAEFPAAQITAHPQVLFLLGELARLRSDFNAALAWYAQAERAWRAENNRQGVSSALRGQALVYIDTVNPTQAESLLQEALRLMDGIDDRSAQARLLELLAENKLNMGRVEEGEQLRAQARELREGGPSEDTLSVRVKVRTGHLDDARAILDKWSREERGQMRPPRGHRETLLLLSLVDSMQGRGDEALATAQEGVMLGTQFASPFISAVGQMRVGHAQQIRGELGAALACYKESIALGDQLAVRRTRAEAMWGMTRAYGILGDLPSAQQTAAEGIAIGRQAGDIWVAALTRIALGATFVLARQNREAVENLRDAVATMRACGDTFGQCAAQMWLALAHWHLNQRERSFTHLADALEQAQVLHYDYLFTTRTLLGLHDARMIVPVLLEARKRGKQVAYISRLLAANGLENIGSHPGYQLRVQTLGAFRVWRGEVELTAREWTRKKARQLLQLFITRRGRMLEREEVFEFLWANESAEAAARDFKVALNALNNTLEPERQAESSFIARQESAYGLQARADIWIDVDEFTQLVARAESSAGDEACDLLRRALALYHDDYLSVDARYDDWALAERERLLALYMRAADRLASELLASGALNDCIEWCAKILARDPCWEHAYRLLMRAHAQRGDRAQAQRVFERCVSVLKKDVGLTPSTATLAVYQQVVGAPTPGD